MARVTQTIYSCDKCGKKLSTCDNVLHIVTDMTNPGSVQWQRLDVQIVCHSGVHNDSETIQADLCQLCAIALLKAALSRVTAGERASAGVESSAQQGWNK